MKTIVLPSAVKACIRLAQKHDFPYEITPDGSIKIDAEKLMTIIEREKIKQNNSLK